MTWLRKWLRRKTAAASKWLTHKSVPHYCPACKRLRYSDVPRGTPDAGLALERICGPCWRAMAAVIKGRETDRLMRQAMREAAQAGDLTDLLR